MSNCDCGDFFKAPIARVDSNGESVQHSINADVRQLWSLQATLSAD
jgi:hypothetical protein